MPLESELRNLYRRLRKRSMELNKEIIHTLTGEDIKRGGAALGILQKDTLIFDSEDMTSILMDYCLFQPGKNGKSKVQSYIEAHTEPEHLDDRVLFNAMLGSRYSLFSVTQIERGYGVNSKDVFRGDQGFIMDIKFSKSTISGMVYAGRLLPVHERFSMSTGAFLPLDRSALTWVMDDLLPRYLTSRGGNAYIPLKRYPEMETEIIKYLISHGVAERFETSNITRKPSSGQPNLEHKAHSVQIGRNAPCPCGSGKKYKKCCMLKIK